MTTMKAAPDGCARCARALEPTDAFCGGCGARRPDEPVTMPIPLPRQRQAAPAVPPAPAEDERRPGIVLAAQIMLGISIAADTFMLLFGGMAVLALGSLAGSIGALDGGGDVQLALVVSVLGLVMLLVGVVVTFRAQRGIGLRRRSSRTVVTVLPAVEAAFTLVLLIPLGAENVVGGVASLVIGLPWAGAIVLMLWLPADSRRWFGDPPRT